MFRNIFRLTLIGIVLVAVGGFVLGWWNGDVRPERDGGVVGTTGYAGEVEPGADDPGASATLLTDDTLAVVIKSRMVREEGLAAEGIQVRLSDGVVRLSGTVRSAEQQERAIEIARETEGVHDVIDELRVLR